MSALKWDKRLETGIPAIDGQHKGIYKRIDKLGLAILNGKGKVELITLINFLVSYVDEHFDAEEKLLSDLKYPGFSNHCEEHQQFRKLCKDLVHEYQTRGVDQYLAIDTEKKLVDWWEHHILKSDMLFIPFVEKEGWEFP